MSFDIIFELTGSGEHHSYNIETAQKFISHAGLVLYRLYMLWNLDSRSTRIACYSLVAFSLVSATLGVSAIVKGEGARRRSLLRVLPANARSV